MTNKELQNIISQGEKHNIEFKQSFNKQAIETIVAFSNTKGGKILIGVSNSGNITGVKINSESLQNWQNEIKLKTQPSVFPYIEASTIKNKTIVKIEVPEYPVKPIATQGRFFVRRNNSNHLLTASEINDVYLQSIQTSWDSYPYPDAQYTDLDEQKIIKFLQRVNQGGRFNLKGTAFESLQKLRLLKNNTPTNAAMLLFSKEELFYNVHIGRFKTQSHIIDDKMVRGTLFEAVENTMMYIISHLKVAFEITGKTSQRTEIFEYPLPAIRELVLNAIIHRDYQSPTDIQIRIFDNQITLFNPGSLYGNLTIDDLKTDNYQAQSRNKLVTEAFYLTKDIEKYGSGYRRIREYISEYPTMYFDFEENSGGFLTKIGYKEQKVFEKLDNVPDDVLDDIPEDVPDGVPNKRFKIIIKIIEQNNKVFLQEIADELKVSKRTIRRDIEKLKQQNKLKRIGAEKNGYWKIIENNHKAQKVFEKSEDVPDDVLDDVPDKRFKIIIKLIEQNNKVLLQEIASELKVSKRTIRRDIEKLKQQNKLERIGSEKNGYWKIIENNHE